MADIRIENSNYVFYVLQRAEEASIKTTKAPEGWNEDDLEIIRNKKYHGILTQFTNALTFRGVEKDFINEAFALDGNNARLYLMRYVLKEGHSYVVGDDVSTVKFRMQYRGIADFDTKKEKDGGLSINFNSQELDKLIESFQSDALSINRDTDLDNEIIRNLGQNKVQLKGRTLVARGWAENTMDEYNENYIETAVDHWFSIPTQFGVKGFGRHVEVTNLLHNHIQSGLNIQANAFYNDVQGEVEQEVRLEISLKFRIKVDLKTPPSNTVYIRPSIKRYEFDFDNERYDYVSTDWRGGGFNQNEWAEFEGDVITYDYGTIKNTTLLVLAFECGGYNMDYFWVDLEVDNYRIDVKEASKFETQELYNFNFVNDVANRLMEIITGKTMKFYSKVFGRKIQNYNQLYEYAEDGEWGHIGLIHGFDIRRFSFTNPLYKGMEVSLKSLIDSLFATFAIGVGIEDSKFGSRLRFEKINHFYQNKTVVRLDNSISEVERSIDAKIFNSSGSFGSNKGGDYEFGLGLDEPNSKSDYIFPLKNTSNKYSVLSDIRSDDTGMELIRRQPEWLDETRDAQGDDNIWYLDTKRSGEGNFEQLDWNDALAYQPNGISDPDSYRSWRFTPKRSMFRHGSIIRGGMEQVRTLNKYITLGSSKANVNLETKYLPNIAPSETKGAVSEKNGDKAFRLDNAMMLPEIIKFKYPIDDELMDWLMATTPVMIGGEIEDVPNWYFKIGWKNENGKNESGYLLSAKPKSGVFEFQKSNDDLLGVTETSEEELCFSAVLTANAPTTFKVGGTGYIKWNDGTPDTFYNGREVEVEKYIDSYFFKTIEFYGTLTLLYIEDTNTNFTHSIDDLPTEMYAYINHSANLCFGNVINLPIIMRRFEITGSNVIEGNVSDFPMGLAIVSIGGYNTIEGNISQAGNINNVLVWILTGKNKVDNYTEGVLFDSNVITFWHLPDTGFGLSSFEVDNILIDLHARGMGRGMIVLNGNNSARTSFSDTAVIGLQARGVSVTTN